MSSDPTCHSTSRTLSPPLPTLTALGEVPSPDPESNGEVKQDQLAFTIEFLSHPQLQLFKTVFNTGKPLSGYCQDDPLWLLLAEKTCSLANILRYWYFTRRCNQDLAYSRRFLELHGTPAHQSIWGIPLSAWREYDTALHAHTSSTSTLLELNMLDERDTADADQQELQKFLALQQGEAAVAARHKCNRSPLPVAGPSSKKIWLDAPKKCFHLVASTSIPAPPCASPSSMEVPNRDLPMQGPSNLVWLAAVAEVHSGLVQQAVSPSSAQTPIKGTGQDLLSSDMSSTSCPTLLLESQLVDSQWENSFLTSAVWDTSLTRLNFG
ncbi:hypothetical protein C8J55DRAFT_565973 [Lentinula edodes]|uniref:Uncharacterized protein n=1 Tax=Lentinula lateritia TaxID=40482 RepID=A0A9W9DF33_9AGAR|nr:hypothetical protein C8J55DRAFT_565973 [Lentinula edodes]